MHPAPVPQVMVVLTITMALTITASVTECSKSVREGNEVEEEAWEVMATVEWTQARAFTADTLCT